MWRCSTDLTKGSQYEPAIRHFHRSGMFWSGAYFTNDHSLWWTMCDGYCHMWIGVSNSLHAGHYTMATISHGVTLFSVIFSGGQCDFNPKHMVLMVYDITYPIQTNVFIDDMIPAIAFNTGQNEICCTWHRFLCIWQHISFWTVSFDDILVRCHWHTTRVLDFLSLLVTWDAPISTGLGVSKVVDAGLGYF